MPFYFIVPCNYYKNINIFIINIPATSLVNELCTEAYFTKHALSSKATSLVAVDISRTF